MRRVKAPMMFCWGMLMVMVQILATTAVLINIIFASCATNTHCSNFVTYCQVLPGRTGGRCLPCGEGAPLVPYFSDIDTSDKDLDVGDGFALYNYIQTGSYPRAGMMKRELTPRGFAGYNLSMVTVSERFIDPLPPLHMRDIILV